MKVEEQDFMCLASSALSHACQRLHVSFMVLFDRRDNNNNNNYYYYYYYYYYYIACSFTFTIHTRLIELSKIDGH